VLEAQRQAQAGGLINLVTMEVTLFFLALHQQVVVAAEAQMDQMAMEVEALEVLVAVVVGDYQPAQALLEQRDKVMQEALV